MDQRDGDANCVFGMIVSGGLPSQRVYEDDEILAFRDIEPSAPCHILVIPKAHIPTLNDQADDQAHLPGRMLLVARDLAREEGISENGYRLVVNVNRGAGQIVFHIHLHLLGGRGMAGMG